MRCYVPDIIVSVPFQAQCVSHFCFSDHHLNYIISFLYCSTSIISCLQP